MKKTMKPKCEQFFVRKTHLLKFLIQKMAV